MTPANKLADHSYRGLLKAVKDALSAGLVSVQKALEYQRVKTYWTVGREFLKRVRASRGALTLNNDLYERMSGDIYRELGLDLSVDTIRRSIQFSKDYPVFPKNTPLTFTHYLALMRVEDPGRRRQLERQAVKEAMSSYELKQIILKLNASPALLIDRKTKALAFERGEPYVYSVHPFTDLQGKEEVCVDCGFRIHLPISGSIIKRPVSFSGNKTRYVRAVKRGAHYDLRLAVRKRNMIYTYAARVLKVVDGDTLDALIDVGFGIRIQDRLRLKAINAPEITTRAGQNARRFLTDTLAKCPIIIVRTSKAGMYGRWLGDVFALPFGTDPQTVAAEGEYLNQTMITRGYARDYEK